MTANTRLLDAVEEIYGAAMEPARWPGALDRVADCLAAQHAHFFIADTRTMVPSFAAVGHTMAEDLLYEFHAHYQELDPRIETGMRLPAGVLYPDHMLCDQDAFERSEFYNDFYRRCGSRWMVGAMLERTETVTTGFAVVRTPRQGPFEDRDLRQLELLRPHLTQAARMQRRLAGEAARWAMGPDLLDRLGVGVVTLDRQGRPVVVNRAAHDIFASRDGLSLGPQGPYTPNGRTGTGLQEALTAALRCARGDVGVAPLAVAVRRPSMKRPYEVLVAPLPALSSGANPDEAGVLILITDPERMPQPPEDLLAALYGLTPAEARVAAALAAGQTLREIAEATNTTREAARWHLKQIFQKTRTHRQAELIKLLRGGPLAQVRWEDQKG